MNNSLCELKCIVIVREVFFYSPCIGKLAIQHECILQIIYDIYRVSQKNKNYLNHLLLKFECRIAHFKKLKYLCEEIFAQGNLKFITTEYYYNDINVNFLCLVRSA